MHSYEILQSFTLFKEYCIAIIVPDAIYAKLQAINNKTVSGDEKIMVSTLCLKNSRMNKFSSKNFSEGFIYYLFIK